MIPYRPKRVLIQEQSWNDSATREILDKLPGVEIETVPDQDALLGTAAESAPAAYPKNTLILVRYPGRFLKNCQGSGAEMCCNYFVASYAWNCHFECTYCVLQSYLSNEALVVCTNIDDMLSQIRDTLDRSPAQRYRIGTGELADSLALDHLTGYSRRLVTLFAATPNGILELKTKSSQIANLEGVDHRGHTVVSWSVNSKRISRTEEHGAATLEERLAAAAQCRKWGYKLGFHFDPLIHYEGWEDDYRESVKEIFRAVDPGAVAWISLGALRFPPHLRELVRRRFPKSRVPRGEFVPGHHGKMRYFRPIREEMYRKMYAWIREQAPGVFVYLCMENRLVWERSIGQVPGDALGFSDQLDARVFPA
ncbi:MAG: Radical domain protein [Acidobacteria bacterium]|nr:Radical domain protein [Acidobacteriota bacterium]